MSAGAGLSRGTDPGIAMEAQIDAMPIMARRPFFSSETRFSASCAADSFLVKPGVSQKFCGEAHATLHAQRAGAAGAAGRGVGVGRLRALGGRSHTFRNFRLPGVPPLV